MWCLKGSGMPVLYIDAWWLTDNKEPQSLLWKNAVFIGILYTYKNSNDTT